MRIPSIGDIKGPQRLVGIAQRRSQQCKFNRAALPFNYRGGYFVMSPGRNVTASPRSSQGTYLLFELKLGASSQCTCSIEKHV